MSAPACPQCGAAPMRERTNTKDQTKFWGCPNFKDGCRGSRPITGSPTPSSPSAPTAKPATTAPPSPRADHLVDDLRRVTELLAAATEILTHDRAQLEDLLAAADHDTSF